MKIFRLKVLTALTAASAKLSAALLVNLDATNLPAGPLPVWDNLVDTSALNDFTRNAASLTGVATVPGPVPVNAVLLNGTADFYIGPEAPPIVTGTSSRTIEVWVFNPTVGSEEDMFGWGRRGGPDGSNMTFGFGTHTTWGAVGHWASPYDMDWLGAPSPAGWHYLVYTYDGDKARVYADGGQRNARSMTLFTHYRSPAAARLKFLVGAQNDPNGNPVSYGSTLFLARIRVHNTVFTALEVHEAYNAEAATFGKSLLPGPGTGTGSVEHTFNASVDDSVYGLSLHPDGKIAIGGYFRAAGGLARTRYARLQPDGSPGTGLDVPLNDIVEAIGIQTDGRTVLSGPFSTVDGIARQRAVRLLPDNTVDAGFAITANATARCMALDDSSGAVILGGPFTLMQGATRNYLARLNPDSSLDGAFNPNPNAAVRTPLFQPGGKLLLGGNFSIMAGSTRNRVARLNANGTLDTAFNPNVGGTAVYSMALQADDAIVLGGIFTSVGGVTRTNLARITAGGSLDSGFTATANDIVRSILIQTDGKIILAGNFTNISGATRNRIARLHADGTLDTGFNPNANLVVLGAMLQPDGKIILAGDFTMVDVVPRISLARLMNGPATQSLTIPSASRIQWLRGGTSPETNHVTFDISTDGGSGWTSLGNASRIPGGWERTGLTLPAAGIIRARARIIGGYGNGSSGLVEAVASFSPLDTWRQTHFGTTISTGAAADNADPDKDGLENLVEYAFALNPNAPDAAALPAWQIDDDTYVLTFARPAGVSGVTYAAEYSTTLGNWTPAANAGTADNFIFFTAATGSRLYLRMRITAP